jgi:pimeloyl-ACP methyl ester carboxylesterase
VPGAASGSLMRFGEELLDGRDLRLLSVDRPGLGSSDADEGKTLASVGDDLHRLAATLGGPVPVVANSQGAPFALAVTAVFGDKGFRALLRAVLDDGFRQGPDGYARDTALAMLPWGLDLDALNVPVTVLFGADDTSHSPDLGATLAARIPTAERIVVPGVGGSLLWARPELVLDAALGEPLLRTA